MTTVERYLNIKKLIDREYNDILTQRPNDLGRPYNDADIPLIRRFINDQIRFALSTFTQEEIHQLTQQVITRGFRHLISHLIVEPSHPIQNKFPSIKFTNANIEPLRPQSIFKPEYEPVECPICFDKIPLGSDAAMIQCGHIYCAHCIKDFFKHTTTSQTNKEPCCALCRADIKKLTLNKYSTLSHFANTYH